MIFPFSVFSMKIPLNVEIKQNSYELIHILAITVTYFAMTTIIPWLQRSLVNLKYKTRLSIICDETLVHVKYDVETLVHTKYHVCVITYT